MSKLDEVINLTRLETPIGPMTACADKDGLCLLEFIDEKVPDTEYKEIGRRLNAIIIPGENRCFQNLRLQLDEYYNSIRKEFSIPLSLHGTSFQMAVWKELLKIPYGFTRSYQQQAMALGKQGAVRAVANSNGMNKIAILIPCHRVIGSDGSLTGYGGGLWRKKFLLELEQSGKGQLDLFK